MLGGTFDPPHLGHLVIAAEVRHALALDEVVLMVANDPWQKRGSRDVTPAAMRLEMTEAVVDRRWLRAGAEEIVRGGPSYTVETVEALAMSAPQSDHVVIVGSDAAAGLDGWHRSDDLAALVEIVVVHRPGTPVPTLGERWRVRVVEVCQLDISSTELRQRVRDGRPTDFLLPSAAREVIDRCGLYGDIP